MTEPTLIDNKNRNAAEDASIAVAEGSRELDWKSKSFMASMFMGDLDTKMCFPFPEQPAEDKAVGDEICARVEAWCAENIDGDEIDGTEVIPARIFKGLNDQGLFGIKIPKEYGGLGLSQTNYLRILSIVAKYCGSTAAMMSAHQSIGLPQPLKLFGTPEQKKKYLPLLAKGHLSAFALTEPDVGSDPANMTTTAELSEDGEHWILNGLKLWCTNGNFADLLVVMAKTGSDMRGSREVNRITAFIVETKWEGVDILHRCQFMGIRAIDNGILRFTNVKVPAANLIWGEGKGLRLALTTLNDGRMGIPSISAAGVQDLADELARWGKSRRQWGRSVGEHEAGAAKLATVSGTAYGMAAIASYGAAMSDAGDRDIRMEAAAAKLYNTEHGFQAVDIGLQFRGGRGYETAESLRARGGYPLPLERALRDFRINRIVEGTSDVMHLFLAREALDKHLKLAANLFSKKASMGAKLSTVFKAGLFYSVWYPKLLLGGIFKSFAGFRGPWRTHMRWIDARSRKLGRTLFHTMLRNGTKLEAKQLTLARLVDIGTELAVMALVASRVQTAEAAGDSSDRTRALYFLSESRLHVDALFGALSRNSDAAARKVSKELMEQAEALPPVVLPADLAPLPREFGSDLTSGRQEERIGLGGTAPSASGTGEEDVA